MTFLDLLILGSKKLKFKKWLKNSNEISSLILTEAPNNFPTAHLFKEVRLNLRVRRKILQKEF
jgi:hypothetical protein